MLHIAGGLDDYFRASADAGRIRLTDDRGAVVLERLAAGDTDWR